MQWFWEDGATPFVRAAQSSDTALMTLLLKYGADPKALTANGDNALTASAGIGWVEGVTYERSAKENLEAMRMLLDLGLDPNHANVEGRTALMGAALKGRSDVVQLLVDRGAKLDQHDQGSRDTDKVGSIAAGATWQPIDYAEGLVRVGVQSAIARPDGGAHPQADDRARHEDAADRSHHQLDLRRVALPGHRAVETLSGGRLRRPWSGPSRPTRRQTAPGRYIRLGPFVRTPPREYSRQHSVSRRGGQTAL